MRIIGIGNMKHLMMPAACALALLGASNIFAADDNEIAELKARIARLEHESGAQAAATATKATTKSNSIIDFYGFLRLDSNFHDSRANDTQVRMWVLSEDDGAPAAISAEDDTQDFTMYPRLTRFGFDLNGGTVAGLSDAALTGKFEVDFYNGGTESRNALRMRVAYANLAWAADWGKFEIRAGQDWDLGSQLNSSVNADGMMWNAGNPGDRRPQFRLSYSPKIESEYAQIMLQAAATLGNAVDNQDMDANGLLDAEASARPGLQARLQWGMAWFQQQTLTMSGWIARHWEKLDAPVAGEDSFTGDAYGVELKLPLYKQDTQSFSSFMLQGEAWRCRNGDDLRMGIGQGINAGTGQTIDAAGYYVELLTGLYTNEAKTFKDNLILGFSMDDPQNEDIAPGARSLNRVIYVANHFVWGNVTLGVEYMSWVTDYKAFGHGDMNAFKAFLQYNF